MRDHDGLLSAGIAGRGPVADTALSAGAGQGIVAVLETGGAAEARLVYAERMARWGSLSWWQPFTEPVMNDEGYKLLERGRKNDAVEAFTLNADRFPGGWAVWDSLGEGLMGAGRNAEAIAAYEKALALSSDNFNAGFENKAIEKMRAAGDGR